MKKKFTQTLSASESHLLNKHRQELGVFRSMETPVHLKEEAKLITSPHSFVFNIVRCGDELSQGLLERESSNSKRCSHDKACASWSATTVLAAEISLQRSSLAGSQTTGKATPIDCESQRAESSAVLGSDKTQPPQSPKVKILLSFQRLTQFFPLIPPFRLFTSGTLFQRQKGYKVNSFTANCKNYVNIQKFYT